MKKMIIAILLINSMGQAKMFDLSIFKNKIVGKNVGKLSKELEASPHINKMLLKNVATTKTSNDVVSSVALAIANKSQFADKLMATTAYPTDVIRQYSKYGNQYLLHMKEFGNKTLALSLNSLQSLKNKFPSMPKIEFKTSEAFNDKMIETLRHTGAKGWKVSQSLAKLAQSHPKSTAVVGLYAWYVTDPESFFEQKEALMAFVASTLKEGVSDVTEVMLEASSGIANGFISVVKEKLNISNIIVMVLIFLLFISWKLRSYIKMYFKIKLDKRLDTVTRKSKKLNNEEDNEGLL